MTSCDVIVKSSFIHFEFLAYFSHINQLFCSGRSLLLLTRSLLLYLDLHMTTIPVFWLVDCNNGLAIMIELCITGPRCIHVILEQGMLCNTWPGYVLKGRVPTVPGNAWNFAYVFSRPWKSWSWLIVLEKSWKTEDLNFTPQKFING
jgi:hypothetical protein